MEAKFNESEALETLLALNASRPHRESLSEEGLVELGIRFVNSPTLGDKFRLLARDPAPEFEPVLIPTNDAQVAFAKIRSLVTDQEVADGTKTDREQARADLHAIVDGFLTPEAFARLATSASQQVQLPVYDLDTDGALRIRYRYRAVSVTAVLDHVVLLLLDPKRPFRRDLCRCKLEYCRTFFLADRITGGRPRTDYCSKIHMRRAHEAAGAKRAEVSRKARAKKANEMAETKIAQKSTRHK